MDTTLAAPAPPWMPGTKPTKEQIAAEAKEPGEMKPKVKVQSRFGDNHHDAIDAQRDVLEGKINTEE